MRHKSVSFSVTSLKEIPFVHLQIEELRDTKVYYDQDCETFSLTLSYCKRQSVAATDVTVSNTEEKDEHENI